ncbi:unnamed protein product [Mytilus edulis]|uniref:Ankyrin repeat protein n=1 Tax=Mytilus edulis TaxID=6550 RepID=A0A8S3UIE8_MYTED|nr:unnamed protein product [Mytilus edulis]
MMNKACSYGCLDVVTFILDKIDLQECDMIESINIVSNPPCLNDMNHDSIVLEIMYKACCCGYLDVVTFVLENTDHKKIDIMTAVYIAYSSINEMYDEDDIYEETEKYESMIKLILEKADHDLLDLKEIMNKACRFDCLDVVTFLLENSDHEKLHIMKAVNIAYSSISDEDDDDGDIYEKREKKEQLFKLILEKVDHDLLDLKEIMNKACRYNYLDVVTCLLENTDHEKLDLMEDVNTAYSSLWYRGDIDEQREKKEPLIKLIIKKVDHDLLDLKEIMNKACRYDCLDVVTCLLENTEHEKLDIMEAVNSAYNLLLDRGDIDEQRKKKEPVIKLILEKVDHDSLDLKEIMNKACLYDHLDVVTFLLEKCPS